jgi:hypothetical protein
MPTVSNFRVEEEEEEKNSFFFFFFSQKVKTCFSPGGFGEESHKHTLPHNTYA